MKIEDLNLELILKSNDLVSLLTFEDNFDLIKEIVASKHYNLISKLKIDFEKDLPFVKELLDLNPKIVKFMNIELKYLEELVKYEPYILIHLYEPSDYFIYIGAKKDPSILNQFYYRKISEKYLIELVKENGLILKFISPKNQTEKIIEEAIKNNPKAYKFATKKNLKFDKIVLSKDISLVPYSSGIKEETIEYFLEYSFDYFPEIYKKYPDYFDENRLKEIVNRKPDFIFLIKNPSDDLKLVLLNKDPELYFQHFEYDQNFLKKAIEQNGLLLKYLKKKDLKTIIKAIKNNVLALDYVENKRKILLDIALETDGLAIKYIDNPTYEQYKQAIESNPFAIQYIPYEKQTEELQLLVVKKLKEEAVKFIKPKSEKVIMEILKIVPSYIFEVENPTDDMYRMAFSEAGQLMISFDNWEEKFNEDLKLTALANDGTILKYFKNQTEEEVKTAIQSYPLALQWVNNQTEDIILYAIKLDPKALYYADKTKITEKILDTVLTIDPDFYKKTEGEMTFEEWQEHLKSLKGE